MGLLSNRSVICISIFLAGLFCSSLPSFAFSDDESYQSCDFEAPPPVVTVIPIEETAVFDNSKTSLELDVLRSGEGGFFTKSPDGLMQSFINMKPLYKFKTRTDDDAGIGCVWLQAIDLEIHIQPKVYIAKEHVTVPCRFGQMFEHEIEHVEIDREVIEEYQERFIDGFGLLFSKPQDYMTGGVRIEALNDTANKMQEDYNGALNALFTGLMKERYLRQKFIDDKVEYSRFSRGCPAPS